LNCVITLHKHSSREQNDSTATVPVATNKQYIDNKALPDAFLVQNIDGIRIESQTDRQHLQSFTTDGDVISLGQESVSLAADDSSVKLVNSLVDLVVGSMDEL